MILETQSYNKCSFFSVKPKIRQETTFIKENTTFVKHFNSLVKTNIQQLYQKSSDEILKYGERKMKVVEENDDKMFTKEEVKGIIEKKNKDLLNEKYNFQRKEEFDMIETKNVVRNEEMQELIISKEDFKKYFGKRNTISRKEYEKYFEKKNNS